MAKVRQRELLDHDERTERQQSGELLVRLPELQAERFAAGAAAQVPAHERSGAPLETLGDLSQLDSHLLARERARLGRFGE
jgi:hypothetical protein